MLMKKTCSAILSCFLAAFHSKYVGSQFPNQGVNPCPPALEVQTLNHWTAREFSSTILNF